MWLQNSNFTPFKVSLLEKFKLYKWLSSCVYQTCLAKQHQGKNSESKTKTAPSEDQDRGTVRPVCLLCWSKGMEPWVFRGQVTNCQQEYWWQTGIYAPKPIRGCCLQPFSGRTLTSPTSKRWGRVACLPQMAASGPQALKEASGAEGIPILIHLWHLHTCNPALVSCPQETRKLVLVLGDGNFLKNYWPLELVWPTYKVLLSNGSISQSPMQEGSLGFFLGFIFPFSCGLYL